MSRNKSVRGYGSQGVGEPRRYARLLPRYSVTPLLRYSRAALLALLFSLFSLQAAHAVNYYVDGNCANDGNGLADQCASSPGGPGAWNARVSDSAGGVQNCFNTLVAGDTCSIKEIAGGGVYLTHFIGIGGDARVSGGFHPMHSGTASSKITYRAYPGHHPVLQNCTTRNTQGECQHQTISANGQNYITYDGLSIQGAMYLLNSGTFGRGLEIKNCDVTDGWFNDGNWSGIYLERWDGAWVHHNLIHDIIPVPGPYAGATGLKQYSSINTIVEFNTFNHNTPRANGIDAKYDGVNNTFRYNYFHDIDGNCMSFNHYSPINVPDPGSGAFYGNVCHRANTGLSLGHNIVRAELYNNTFYDIGELYYQASDEGNVSGFRAWNNIVRATGGEGGQSTIYGPTVPNMSDYNTWQANMGFTYGGNGYSNLAAVQSALGLDSHSTTTPCSFVNAAGADFHLQSGTFCTSAGRVGGVTSGAVVELGAYGATTCVGHTCGGTPPPANRCDLNNSGGQPNVTDVQLCTNQAIGIAGCSTGDINSDNQCNVIDVQRVVNAALGGACVTQ